LSEEDTKGGYNLLSTTEVSYYITWDRVNYRHRQWKNTTNHNPP